MTPDALKSLIGSGEREQEILTPPRIVRAVLTLWPRGIALDPCAPQSLNLRVVPAAEHYTGSPMDGLREPWADRTYCNPPYAELAAWLGKARREADEGKEVALLVPMRTHREWFSLAAWERVCLLRPLKFVGYACDFPAPLAVLYGGKRISQFDTAFGGLGRCGSFIEAEPQQGALW